MSEINEKCKDFAQQMYSGAPGWSITDIRQPSCIWTAILPLCLDAEHINDSEKMDMNLLHLLVLFWRNGTSSFSFQDAIYRQRPVREVAILNLC